MLIQKYSIGYSRINQRVNLKLYEIASTGQSVQRRQRMHCEVAPPSSKTFMETGQFLWHLPHAMHLSLSTATLRKLILLKSE